MSRSLTLWGWLAAVLLVSAGAGCGGGQATLASNSDSATPEANDKAAEPLARTLFFVQTMDRLKKKAIRKALALDDAQITVIDRLGAELDALSAEAQSASSDDSERIGQAYEAMTAKIEAELKQTLTTEQYEEVRQTVVREQIGATVFLMPGVRKAIELTDEQLNQIRAIIGAHHEELQPRNFTFWNLRKLISLGRQLRAEAELLLTESQQELWQEVLSGARPLSD